MLAEVHCDMATATVSDWPHQIDAYVCANAHFLNGHSCAALRTSSR